LAPRAGFGWSGRPDDEFRSRIASGLLRVAWFRRSWLGSATRGARRAWSNSIRSTSMWSSCAGRSSPAARRSWKPTAGATKISPSRAWARRH